MSGHSKWSTIKRKKGAIDAKRGKIFSKINKEIMVAARTGGGDIDNNPRLRTVVAKAKSVNMPSDNVERAIKKGTGDLDGVVYEEMLYEGYGKGGVAILVESLTDNKNRTAPEIKSIFSKKAGNMASPGAVAWMFEKKGLIVIAHGQSNEDTLMDIVLDSGGDDLSVEDETFEITTALEKFEDVRAALEAKGIKYESAELSYIPKNTIKVDDVDTAKNILGLIESLEDNDDVQNVYANFDIPEEVLEKLEA